ncbi:toxin glutamine deamidase domain-containing protein [Micromonospora sp. WMMC250]|uniref:toxin glutamine deamidase domain-containing protein n=1 Tax=Micromonospora sp. WMMC250 TaxID=3014781 RepID=UPI0022B5EC19|nr:toxin glutamine deamidase domain-containing protein [Micromonospora sp. WMMC250]MCZ7376777.1 toxin glutamine deamidase domain-containing protein [Micromonospora sp. WMMC250]
MSVLPSPIPHPLDLALWDVPGWIYEALDWVVGVQWPEGDERAVWDVADRWYDVASVLAGPQTDAAAAAVEVRNGYGGVGAVDAAFEAAWRGIAENPDAPLPVLLAVAADLGRLVEECGCDIEGAKLEVWIELGILVIELLSVAVVAVLTAGAATPAAGAAIGATRLLVQQIIKRLMSQLASKSLKHGLREAGERAAKEVTRDGVRGLAKRAAREGLEEAAEESGVTLATQAYQNSTGRAHGLDLTDLGASAVGGLAGGAVAPLAGLGRHATGRAARVGEHLGREMTGEVLADSAASLATGQGLTSVEDVARAAASGATGSVTGQTDHALRARLDAQTNALAGASIVGPSLPSVAALGSPSSGASSAGMSAVVPVQATPANDVAPLRADPQAVADVHVSASPTVDASSGVDAVDGPLRAPEPMSSTNAPSLTDAAIAEPVAAGQTLPTVAADPALPTVAADSVLSSVDAARAPQVAADPSLSPMDAGSKLPQVVTDPALPPVAADPTLSSVATDPRLSSVATDPTLSSVATDPRLSSVAGDSRLSSVAAPVAGTVEPVGGPATGVTPSQPASPPHTAGPVAWSPSTGAPTPTTTPGAMLPGATAAPLVGTTPTVMGRSAVPSRATTPAPAPEHPARGRASIPLDLVFGDPVVSATETDDFYAAQWAAEAEAAERRRYQGHYESQRTGYEHNRRQAEATRLRARAAEHDRRAIEYATYARQLHQAGHRQWADGWQRAANDEARAYAQWRDLADAVLAGTTAPPVVDIDAATFEHANRDVGALALGAVETSGPSRLTGDDNPPPIDDSRPYGQPGGLRPPLALHQVDVERQMPRESDGTITRTADPRRGGWFRLLNDGGPAADATRGINCLDCTLSLFETWVHGRPRVSAPRTFDGYLDGDIRRPIRGEAGGPGRVEDITGGRFQQLLAPADQRTYAEQARQAADRGYRNLRDQLLLGGHGSYAFLVTEWAHGGSHAWVALNQNGTVLYVDPQTGVVRDRPLYPDVVGIDALVLGGDGRPMPLGGLPRGRFSERPDLPDHPPTYDSGGHGDPYVNRMYLLLDGPGSASPSPGGEPIDASSSTDRGQPSPSVGPTGVILAAGSLDEIFAAGVSPAEFATAADPSALRRLQPDLDEASARDVARLFADSRVRDMLDRAYRQPPANEPDLARHLTRQLMRRPDLARLILSTPELANSLTARPMTLYHLADHQQAIDVLAEVVDDVAQQSAVGLEAATDNEADQPQPTPLTDEQRRISASIQLPDDPVTQPGFDKRRQADPSYREHYLNGLYAAAVVAQAELNQLAVSLAQVGDHRVGEPGWRSQPKDRRRAEDKVDKHQGDSSKLLDLAAAKVEFRSLQDLYAALERLRDHPAAVIRGYDDRFISPRDSGYRDVQLVLQMSNGHLAEFRLHLEALDAVAVWEHVLYEVRRDVEALAGIGGRTLTASERAITAGIRRREQQLFWQALQSTFEGNA